MRRRDARRSARICSNKKIPHDFSKRAEHWRQSSPVNPLINEWSCDVPDGSPTLFPHSQWRTGEILFKKTMDKLWLHLDKSSDAAENDSVDEFWRPVWEQLRACNYGGNKCFYWILLQTPFLNITSFLLFTKWIARQWGKCYYIRRFITA